MPLSTRSPFELGHIGKVKGGSVSALPDLSTDLIEDDFDLNRSFPCTKRLMYTRNRAGLEHFPWLLTGEFPKRVNVPGPWYSNNWNYRLMNMYRIHNKN